MKKPSYSAPQSARVSYLAKPSAVLVAIAGLAALIYFPWRLTTFNPHAMTLSLMLYAAELFGLVTILLHTFMVWRVVDRQSPPPPPGISVDVFIPTYNEPVDMVRRTVIGARDMTYPHSTWLLDDGNRPAMAALAAELGVHYLARTENTHAKAGNLNNAFSRSSGALIAIFDADHVPHRDYLVRTIGYFSDPAVAFVQTPQDFYNLDSFQHRRSARHNVVWSEQSLFFRVIMRGKDYWNASFFCGSCATVRRSALASIGGFATETVTEDLHTSIRLHKKGYGSVYHGQALAYGIAPDTFEPYESQRVRWGQGAMQVWRTEGILSARGLTLAQRLCYLASVLAYFDGWQKAFMYLVPPFVLLAGILPVVSLDWHFAAIFSTWYVLSLLACEELGRGYAHSWMIEQYNFLRCPGFLFATLTFFLNRRLRFCVTKKEGSTRLDNIKRLAPHLSAVAIVLGAVLIAAARFASAPYMQPSAFVLNVIWASVMAFTAIAAVRFSFRHAKQNRASYRFNLPLPIAIEDGKGSKIVLTADDVSSGGLRIQIPGALPVETGTTLPAKLILPSGLKTVSLDVRRCSVVRTQEGSVRHHVGAKFVWPSVADADELDRYLYGSNAQWLFSGLRERGDTPTELVLRHFGRQLHPSLHISDEWRAAIVIPADLSRSIEVLAALNDTMSEVEGLLAEDLLDFDAVTLIFLHETYRAGLFRIDSIERFEGEHRTMFMHKVSRLDAVPHREWAPAKRSLSQHDLPGGAKAESLQ